MFLLLPRWAGAGVSECGSTETKRILQFIRFRFGVFAVGTNAGLPPNPPSGRAAPVLPLLKIRSHPSSSGIKHPAWPSPSSSAGNPHCADKSPFSSLRSLRPKLKFEPPRSKPLFQGFERPGLSPLPSGVRGLDIGFTLGYLLLKIGVQHLEAASKSRLPKNRDFLRLSFKQPGFTWATGVKE